MTLAVLTTVYPQAQAFLDDFHQSLAAQDDQDFCLYVLNDGVERVTACFPAFTNRLRVVPAAGTPAAIRKQGLRALATDGIETVVFADCDDRFAPNRVSVSRQLLTTHRLVVNELIAFGAGLDGQQALLGHLLDEQRPLTWHDLIHGNVLGLSNTAAQVADLLPHLAAIDDRLLAFDWALFTRALYSDRACRFTARTATFYRQHADNSAGILGTDAPALLRSVRVKAAHYANLVDLDAIFARLAAAFANLLHQIESDPQQLTDYAAYAAAAQPAYGPWWSAAPVPAEGFP